MEQPQHHDNPQLSFHDVPRRWRSWELVRTIGDRVRFSAVLAFWLVLAAAILAATSVALYAIGWLTLLCFRALGVNA